MSAAQQRIQSIVSQFRNYDDCVRRWLQTFPSQDDGSPIPVVMSTPDRAFAAMSTLLAAQGRDMSGATVKNIPLPFISVTSGNILFDGARYHGPTSIILGKTEGRVESFSVDHPLPYNISYRVEFWSKNMEPMNALKLWWTASFAQGYEQYLQADLSNVWPAWTSKSIPITNDGMRFVGELEPEAGHRVIRMVGEIVLKGWVIPPVKRAKNIHKIIVNIYAAKQSEDIQRVTAAVVDARPDLYELIDTAEIE